MEVRELGRSGIAVSRVILGCGNFGGVGSSPAFFGQGIPKEEAFRIMDAGWELGLTTSTRPTPTAGAERDLDRRVAT
jgi:aryl-alcohol dehydrogenase-like predicted oxidoreductase